MEGRKRVRKHLLVLLGSLAFFGGLAAATPIRHLLAEKAATVIPLPAERRAVPPPPQTTLLFVGDIMLDRGVKRSVDRNFGGDFAALFANAPYLAEADIAFGNLEGPVSDRGRNVGSIYSFRFDPAVAPALAGAGFDVLSVSNNHMGDWTVAAFEDTLGHLRGAGIATAGGGMTKAEAERPAVIEKNGIRFGYLAFTDVGPAWLSAKEATPGIIQASDPRFAEIIRNAKAETDVLVVSMHWGDEYKPHTRRQETLGRAAIDAGADLVIGAHPHVSQDYEWYGGGLIAYSLGNFIFDQYFSAETMAGDVLTVTMSGTAIEKLSISRSTLSREYRPEAIEPVREERNPAFRRDLEPLSIGWVGDITPTETRTPDGAAPDFFGAVRSGLAGPDLMIGNLEGALTGRTSSKCDRAIVVGDCFAFRADGWFAEALRAAGFDLMNIANNHALDYGEEGMADTERLLGAAGILAAGMPGTVTYATVRDGTVATVGFSHNQLLNDVNDIPKAAALVREARAKADTVIVLFHGGAEGSQATRVPYGTETHLGSARGDLRAFARGVIDAGADLVLGSGPHVLRGMETYQGKLIAYSLGNFAGYRTMQTRGLLGQSGILTVTLDDGRLVGGTFVPATLSAEGIPSIDWTNGAIEQLNMLSAQDFGENAVLFAHDGTFSF